MEYEIKNHIRLFNAFKKNTIIFFVNNCVIYLICYLFKYKFLLTNFI